MMLRRNSNAEASRLWTPPIENALDTSKDSDPRRATLGKERNSALEHPSSRCLLISRPPQLVFDKKHPSKLRHKTKRPRLPITFLPTLTDVTVTASFCYTSFLLYLLSHALGQRPTETTRGNRTLSLFSCLGPSSIQSPSHSRGHLSILSIQGIELRLANR